MSTMKKPMLPSAFKSLGAVELTNGGYIVTKDKETIFAPLEGVKDLPTIDGPFTLQLVNFTMELVLLINAYVALMKTIGAQSRVVFGNKAAKEFLECAMSFDFKLIFDQLVITGEFEEAADLGFFMKYVQVQELEIVSKPVETFETVPGDNSTVESYVDGHHVQTVEVTRMVKKTTYPRVINLGKMGLQKLICYCVDAGTLLNNRDLDIKCVTITAEASMHVNSHKGAISTHKE